MSVAVVIPLFNHERFIGEALRSVLRQTMAVDRVIVIDDGSTDGSIEAARAAGNVGGVGESRVMIVAQENGGAHAAINRGIELAAGYDLIGILNSDDLYEPERVRACMRCLESNPAAGVVATRLKIVDEAGALIPSGDGRARWLRSVWHARPESSLPGWLGIANFTKTTSNLFGRAEYFRGHRFRDYRYVHDYFFAVTAAVEEKLVVLDEELLRYRVHGTNTIKSGAPEALPREVLRMNLDLLREFAPRLAESAEVRWRMAEYFRALSRNYADFRFEPFVHLLAHQCAALTDAEVKGLCATLDGERFPELLAGKSHALRESFAQASYERTLQRLAGSRWMALGRVLGAGPRVIAEGGTAEARLAGLRKACGESRWYRMGRGLGFVYSEG